MADQFNLASLQRTYKRCRGAVERKHLGARIQLQLIVYHEDSTAFPDNLLYQVAHRASKQNVKIIQVPAK